jgi:hypothetical protein
VIELAEEAGVTRGSVNRWLQWYEALGVDGLLTGVPRCAAPRLTESQRTELTVVVEAGPLAAGYQSGVWTGPMIGDLIEQRVRRALSQPSHPSAAAPTRLLGAAPAQAFGSLRRAYAGTLVAGAPARHQKKASACRGDEASFWLDGTLHVTWSKVGVQPRVDTFGQPKTAHVYGAVSIEHPPHFVYQFSDVFNGRTFLDFFKERRRCPRRKVFLIIDNGPCHWLEQDGRRWLDYHGHRIELFRLPTYSPSSTASRASGRSPRKPRPITASTAPSTSAMRPSSPPRNLQARPPRIAGHVARFL